MPLNVLFVCSRNQWRSPTGERMYRKSTDIAVRSAGTSQSARRALTLKDLQWADIVLVMEGKHKDRITAKFRQDTRHKPIHILDIPDDRHFMDPELIDEITHKAGPIITAALNR